MTTLLTLQEAADILRISTDSMRRVSAGELPRFRVGPHGGRLKYRREDIDAYIESRREGEAGTASLATCLATGYRLVQCSGESDGFTPHARAAERDLG